MQQRLLSLKHLTALLILSLSGCASTPDPHVCVKVRPGAGYCRTALSGERMFVDDVNKITAPDGRKFTWFELEPRSVILPYWSWKEIKTFIIQNCKENPNPSCGNVPHWQRSVDDIDKWLEEAYR